MEYTYYIYIYNVDMICLNMYWHDTCSAGWISWIPMVPIHCRPWRSAAGPSVSRCWSSFSLPPWSPSCADPPVWGRKEEQRELMETQKMAENSLCLWFVLENRWIFGCFWGVGASGRLVFGDTQGSRTTKRLHWKLLLQISHQGLQVEAKLSKKLGYFKRIS